ncbi:MAG: outer membrane beta-barrel protein [Sediminibacterium magnilacihabitans]|jgi:hypothetical protein|nr:outer membrane beta-barrel protein [Sediminibacterium magnilacihabitans]PQV59970.1 outer membrane protein with beta-barrel domain [Sediminibacterium magnilacihabitans]
MRPVLTIVIFVLISMSAKSQVTKGNWLLGGTVNFSSSKTATSYPTPTQETDVDITNVTASPTIGYFLMDKFAAGLKQSFSWNKAQVATSGGLSSNIRRYTIGPFFRYYFLDAEKPFNLFTEASYQLGVISNTPQTGSIKLLSVAAGPVIYFNSSVGLEFTIGYSQRSEEIKGSYKEDKKSFQIGIGFQIHLNK